MKQMRDISFRVRFADEEQENRDQNIPAQKTQSFKEKKPQSWFQRQFQRKTSNEYDSKEIEHIAAVAAAAYAVILLDVLEIPQKKKVPEAPETSLTRTKSKADGSKSPISQTWGGTRLYSGSSKSSEVQAKNTPAPSTKKTATFREHPKNTEDKKPETTETPAPKRPPPPVPPPPPPPPPVPTTTKRQTSRKADTFKLSPPTTPPPHVPTTTERQTLRKPDTFKLPTPPPPRSPASPPPPPPPPSPLAPTKTNKQTPTRPGETKADIWLRAELETIKDRFGKLHETIISWENKKKSKARKRLDEHQGEPEKRRMKALQKFQEEMEYIEQIAAEARTQANERQRKEELKAREKADAIRKTGKLPATCFCF